MFDYSKKGVTLPEVMIAFFIFVVAIFGALGAIEYGAKATRKDFRQGEAIQILADRMNKLSALPYKKLESFIKLMGGKTITLNGPIENGDIVFGKINVGNNKYHTYAVLEYMPITFKGLMQLKFPNKEYDPEKPYTWEMVKRGTTGEESFNGKANGKPYAAIKVKVYVKPVEYKMERKDKDVKEREVVAVTYVTDLEN